jgi:hypothetical protein
MLVIIHEIKYLGSLEPYFAMGSCFPFDGSPRSPMSEASESWVGLAAQVPTSELLADNDGQSFAWRTFRLKPNGGEFRANAP